MTSLARTPRRGWIGRRIAASFDALIPAACVTCGRGLAVDLPPLCGLCRARLGTLPAPRCPRCAEPLGSPSAGDPTVERCGTCEDWTPSLCAVESAVAYDRIGASVVRGLKYGGWRSLASVMADVMVGGFRRVARRLEPPDPILVPVPTTRARLRERGFNQALALAVALADRTSSDLVEALRRPGGGDSQTRLAAARRGHNVEGRFRMLDDSIEVDRAIVLVDDVLTTGATLRACADACAQAGFRSIGAVTFARTLRPLDDAFREPPEANTRPR
ncbi:MAG: hypothetical protein MJB57_03010 [Gemmatimonadetes bacterium]|nr:hypothetical protein [Gemmatimonadota bacterium]